MKFSILACFAALLLSSCASLNKKSSSMLMNADLHRVDGKTPMQVKEILGVPFSSGWHKNRDVGRNYYMVYAVASEPEVSSLDVMMGKDMQCYFFYFYPTEGYKISDKSPGSSKIFAPCAVMTQHREDTWTADDSLDPAGLNKK